MRMSDSVRSFDAEALLAEMAWTQRLARRLAGASGDDVAQDVLLAALRQRPQRGSGLRAWLTAVTRRLATRRRRDHGRRLAVESGAARDDVVPSTAETVTRLELHRRLAEAVLALAEPYRSVVVARYFDGQPPAEIARRRAVSEAAVRQQLHRGIASLRARLRGEGEEGERRAWAPVVVPRAVRAALGALVMKKMVVGVATLAVLLIVWERPWLHAPEPRPAPASSEIGAIASTAPEAIDSVASTGAAVSRRAVSEPAVADDVLGVHVLARAAFPVSGARLWLWHGEVLERARTDAAGGAGFTPSDGSGRILVVADGRPASVHELPSLRGVHEIVLPDGASVGGVVRVDGTAPLRPIELSLYDVAAPDAELPARLRAQLAEESVPLDRLAVRTRADGSFAFTGLAPEWWGRIGARPMSPYGVRRDRGLECADLWTALLPAPRDDLVLELTRLPAVTGVVRWADDGAPASGASVRFAATLVGGEPTPETGVATDDAGRFEIGIVPQHARASWLLPEQRVGIAEVRLAVSAPGARACTRTLRGADLDASGDVGVVLLERVAAREVLVVDARGAPVAGAVVEGMERSAPTDARGRARVAASAEQDSFRIAAPDCRVERQSPSGAGTPEDPLRFTVQEGNALDVRVVAEGLAPADLCLELIGTRGVFAGNDERAWLPSPLHRAAGCAASRVATVNGASGMFRVQFELDEQMGVPLRSLVPDVPVALRVTDRLGQVAIEERVRTPAFGDRRRVDLRIDRPICEVTGTVADERGAVARASVMLSGATAWTGKSIATDRDGRFAMRVLATGATARLEVTDARGAHATAELQLVPNLAPLAIRLPRGNPKR
jgi:RNA polymerase sigma-70 factor (ECF subfamily)